VRTPTGGMRNDDEMGRSSLCDLRTVLGTVEYAEGAALDESHPCSSGWHGQLELGQSTVDIDWIGSPMLRMFIVRQLVFFVCSDDQPMQRGGRHRFACGALLRSPYHMNVCGRHCGS
jgi:hypothetical protein